MNKTRFLLKISIVIVSLQGLSYCSQVHQSTKQEIDEKVQKYRNIVSETSSNVFINYTEIFGKTNMCQIFTEYFASDFFSPKNFRPGSDFLVHTATLAQDNPRCWNVQIRKIENIIKLTQPGKLTRFKGIFRQQKSHMSASKIQNSLKEAKFLYEVFLDSAARAYAFMEKIYQDDKKQEQWWHLHKKLMRTPPDFFILAVLHSIKIHMPEEFESIKEKFLKNFNTYLESAFVKTSADKQQQEIYIDNIMKQIERKSTPSYITRYWKWWLAAGLITTVGVTYWLYQNQEARKQIGEIPGKIKEKLFGAKKIEENAEIKQQEKSPSADAKTSSYAKATAGKQEQKQIEKKIESKTQEKGTEKKIEESKQAPQNIAANQENQNPTKENIENQASNPSTDTKASSSLLRQGSGAQAVKTLADTSDIKKENIGNKEPNPEKLPELNITQQKQDQNQKEESKEVKPGEKLVGEKTGTAGEEPKSTKGKAENENNPEIIKEKSEIKPEKSDQTESESLGIKPDAQNQRKKNNKNPYEKELPNWTSSSLSNGDLATGTNTYYNVDGSIEKYITVYNTKTEILEKKMIERELIDGTKEIINLNPETNAIESKIVETKGLDRGIVKDRVTTQYSELTSEPLTTKHEILNEKTGKLEDISYQIQENDTFRGNLDRADAFRNAEGSNQAKNVGTENENIGTKPQEPKSTEEKTSSEENNETDKTLALDQKKEIEIEAKEQEPRIATGLLKNKSQFKESDTTKEPDTKPDETKPIKSEKIETQKESDLTEEE